MAARSLFHEFGLKRPALPSVNEPCARPACEAAQQQLHCDPRLGRRVRYFMVFRYLRLQRGQPTRSQRPGHAPAPATGRGRPRPR